MIIRWIARAVFLHAQARRQPGPAPRLAAVAFLCGMGLGGYFLYALTGNWVLVFLAWALVVVFSSHE